MGSLLLKPVGDRCNLACGYCFYHPNSLTPEGAVMSADVLETTIRKFMSMPGETVKRFGWQGGEPTLAGLDFFKKAVELQNTFRKRDQIVQNAFQTNGVAITAEWAEFFRENSFLIGLSIDGPSSCTDVNRRTKNGRGAHEFAKKAWDVLIRNKVEVNILVVVSAANWDKGGEVYKYITDDLGAGYMQLIPCVEWATNKSSAGVADSAGLSVASTDFSVKPCQYAKFLIDVFNVWKTETKRSISVKLFDDLILFLAGKPMGDCMHAAGCGSHFVIDCNGDVYPCDFFVTPGWKLGNILKHGFAELEQLAKTRSFRNRKKRDRGNECKKCPQEGVCRGGCPKFWRSASQPFYLCDDMKIFFSTCRGELESMAKAVKIRMKEIESRQNGFR